MVRYQNFFKAFEEKYDEEHLDLILENWKNVRPHLIKYSRRNLAP